MIKITAVIPTRGDVDVSPITRHLRNYPEIGHIVVVSSETPYSRYEWAAHAPTDLVYTQDDDCITDIRPLIEAWDATPYGLEVFINCMTVEHAAQYPGAQTLLGFGTIFEAQAAGDFVMTSEDLWTQDELFYREADRIFGTIYTHRSVFPKIEILPHASAPNRLWKQPEHLKSRAAMNERIFGMTGIEAGCL